jgi:hypothetical protein
VTTDVINAFNAASHGILTATGASSFVDTKIGGGVQRLSIWGHDASGEPFKLMSNPVVAGADLAQVARGMVMTAMAGNEAAKAVGSIPAPEPPAPIIPVVPRPQEPPLAPMPRPTTAVIPKPNTLPMTLAPVRSFSEFASTLHQQVMARVNASQERLVRAQANLFIAADGIDAVAEVYEQATRDTDRLVSQLAGNGGPSLNGSDGSHD